jgi:glutathione peroxidase
LAFPCNQFFKQESGSHQEILDFVKTKYNSNFTLFEKVEVNGPDTHPVYRYLRNRSALFDNSKRQAKLIPWNFAKFLLNGKGEVVHFFEPGDSLDDVRKAV